MLLIHEWDLDSFVITFFVKVLISVICFSILQKTLDRNITTIARPIIKMYIYLLPYWDSENKSVVSSCNHWQLL